MNKKFFALLLAGAISFAAAGCMHKGTSPVPEAEETASVQEDSTAPSKEKITTRNRNYTYETIIITDKNGVTHKVAVTDPKVTQYTTRKPSPSRLTTRPTAARTTVRTTVPTTARITKPATTVKPATTGTSFKAPKVEYSGTYKMGGNSVKIRSHTASLSQNNSIIVMLDIDVLSVDGKSEYMYIGYDCYDSSGKKLNDEPVKCVVAVRQNEQQTKSVATAPVNTAKIVFKSI
jgi:predicted small lipoprotein YifL